MTSKEKNNSIDICVGLYNEQFKKVISITESARERVYRKVNEELILMYRDIGEYISLQSKNTEYGDAFVQKLGSLTPQIAKSLVWLCFFVKNLNFYVAICGYV